MDADLGPIGVTHRGGDHIDKDRNRTRNRQVKFWATDEELRQILDRMGQQHIHSMGTYLRKMAIDGYCISMDMTDIRELTRLLRICSNNLNQYAHMANATGNIYKEDIQDLQQRLDQIWENMNQILGALSAIR